MWHMKWNSILKDMGFRPCKAEPNLWMRCKGNYYEYVSVMIDDVIIFSHQQNLIIESIINLFNDDLKEVGFGEPGYILHAPPNDDPPPRNTLPPPIPPEPPPC